jgi:4-hydroxybenzoate polyprenyltransferase
MFRTRASAEVRALIKTMRPRQWVKNVVLFAALVFDRQLGLAHIEATLRTLAGFIIFCLLSGVVYIINDLADIESDRQHPDKKKRPIASGELSIRTAQTAAIIILIFIIPISFWLSLGFGIVATSFFILNLAYSKWLKHIVLLDVFSIALGFVLRVAAGVMLIQVSRFSPWLYIVTTLVSLFIGFGKRRAELILLDVNANSHRKVLSGYTTALLDQYILVVSSTTIIAYSLYSFSAPNLPANHAMMLTIPFVLYGVFRYLYLINTKNYGGAPEEVLYSDRSLQVTILLWVIAILIIFYIF